MYDADFYGNTYVSCNIIFYHITTKISYFIRSARLSNHITNTFNFPRVRNYGVFEFVNSYWQILHAGIHGSLLCTRVRHGWNQSRRKFTMFRYDSQAFVTDGIFVRDVSSAFVAFDMYRFRRGADEIVEGTTCFARNAIFREANTSVSTLYGNASRRTSFSQSALYFVFEWVIVVYSDQLFVPVRACLFIYVQSHLAFEPKPLSIDLARLVPVFVYRSFQWLRIIKFVQNFRLLKSHRSATKRRAKVIRTVLKESRQARNPIYLRYEMYLVKYQRRGGKQPGIQSRNSWAFPVRYPRHRFAPPGLNPPVSFIAVIVTEIDMVLRHA